MQFLLISDALCIEKISDYYYHIIENTRKKGDGRLSPNLLNG
jgi:hypothetical protein